MATQLAAAKKSQKNATKFVGERKFNKTVVPVATVTAGPGANSVAEAKKPKLYQTLGIALLLMKKCILPIMKIKKHFKGTINIQY